MSLRFHSRFLALVLSFTATLGAWAQVPEIFVQRGTAGAEVQDGGTVNLGDANYNTDLVFSFTIRNTGSYDLTNILVTKDGTNASEVVITSPSPAFTVSPAASTTINGYIRPLGLGLRTAALHIANTDPDENPFDINLTANAVAAVPEIFVQRGTSGVAVQDGGTVDLGDTYYNNTATFTFTIRNTGASDLTNIIVTKDGTNASEVVITNPLPAFTVSPAGSTTINGYFRPLGLGLRTATLHIANDDPDENPFDINLTANGVSAEIVVEWPATEEVADGGSRTFGTVALGSSETQTVTIKNTGTATLSGLSVSTVGPHDADFVITQPPSPGLQIGNSSTFTVKFAPKTRGTRSVELRVANTDPDENPYNIFLSGTAMGPEIVVEQPAGTNKMDGSSADFGTVAVGSSSSQTFTLKNVGDLDLTGLTVTKDGNYAPEFIVTANPAGPLAPDGSTTFTVEFRPIAHGIRSAALHIASNDLDENPFDLMLSGLAMGSELDVEAPSSIQLADGSSRSFGSQSISLSSSQTFTLFNRGNATLNSMAVTVDGTHAADFTVTQPQVTEVNAGSSTPIQVVFRPSASGARTAALHITSNDGDENPYDITLTGTGLAPDIRVDGNGAVEISSGGSVSFGSGDVGAPILRNLTIRNLGPGTLVFGEMGDAGTHASEFSVPTSAGETVPNGGTWNWPIIFTPQGPGLRTTKAYIHSNDPDEEPYEITLSGTGLQGELTVEQPADTPLADGQNQSFGGLNLGAERTVTFTLKNTGTLAMTLDASILGLHPADFTLTTAPASPLAVGQSTQAVVKYQPTSLGARQAELRISHNGSNIDGDFSIPLTGTTFTSDFFFSTPLFKADQGAVKVDVVVRRTNPGIASTVQLWTSYAQPQNVPPMSTAHVPGDYVMPANGVISFAVGETEKTVPITLVPKAARAKTNLHFLLELKQPSAGAALGHQATATVRVLGADNVKPTLTLTTPAAGKDSMPLPLTITGRAGDAMGIDRVEVKLDDEDPVEAMLSPATTSTSIPFVAQIPAANGLRVLVVTAYDLRGNSTSVTRSFTFTRRQRLTISYKDTSSPALNVTGGTVAMAVTPATAASAWIPTGILFPKSSAVVPGSTVKLVAKPAKGYVFSRWLTPTEPAPVLNVLGDVVTFTMLDAATTVQAEFSPTPFALPPGSTTVVGALLEQTLEGSLPPFAQQGYLSGTLTDTGSFTGKLLMNGESVPVAAALYANSPAVFTVAGQKRDFLTLPGGQLKLRLENNNDSAKPFRAVVTTAADSAVFTSLASRAAYSATKKVPAGLLNAPTKGTYTLFLDSPTAPGSPPDLVKHPSGHGYATVTLTNAGVMTLTGVLADTTPFTMSTPLLAGNNAPVYVQLPTPGGTTKKGLIMGTLAFLPEAASTATKLHGPLSWYRPQALGTKVLLYPDGWPAGVNTFASGGFYNPAITFETALGVTGESTLSLTFTGGNLPDQVVEEDFDVVKNAVIKHSPTDKSFTLTLNAATGMITGTFTPTWGTPATALPTFKGLLIQTADLKSAAGFFISNAKNDPAPKSGAVTLMAD
ncbi:MAG: choice-of-anchor D domain-containing protein [Verrucomicrobiota bacterium]